MIRFLCSAQRVVDLLWPCSVASSSLLLRSRARLGASLSVLLRREILLGSNLLPMALISRLCGSCCPCSAHQIRRILIHDRLLNSGGIGVFQKFPRPWRFACNFHRDPRWLFEVCALTSSTLRGICWDRDTLALCSRAMSLNLYSWARQLRFLSGLELLWGCLNMWTCLAFTLDVSLHGAQKACIATDATIG